MFSLILAGVVVLALVPLAFCLSRFTELPFYPLFAIVTWSELIKSVIGKWMVKSGIWINTIVD